MRNFLPTALVLLLASLSAAQTTKPTIQFEPELRDALNGLDKHISPEVRENKRPPSEREKKMARLMTVLLMSERPDQADTGKRNAANVDMADQKIRDEYRKMKADPANAAAPIQGQLDLLEKLSVESIHLLDLLSRPSNFPTTRASQLDLAQRLNQLPGMLDREDALNRQLAHEERRLNVMQEIAKLEKAGDQADKVAANKELLAALDRVGAAQAKLDALATPTTQPAK